MKRATMRSGAFMTQTSQGMVRGCRACKAPLAADMSCTRCGPKLTAVSDRTVEMIRVARVIGIPLRDNTCRACGYVEHAPTCSLLRAEQAELERIRADVQRQLQATFSQLEAQRAQEDAQARAWMQMAQGTAATITYQAGVNGTSGYTYTDTRNAYALGLGAVAGSSQPVPHTSNNFAAYVAQRAYGGGSK